MLTPTPYFSENWKLYCFVVAASCLFTKSSSAGHFPWLLPSPAVSQDHLSGTSWAVLSLLLYFQQTPAKLKSPKMPCLREIQEWYALPRVVSFMPFGNTTLNTVQGKLILVSICPTSSTTGLFFNFEKVKRETYLLPVTINYVLVSGFILTATKAEMII